MSDRAVAFQGVGEPVPQPLRSVVTLLRLWAPATVATLVLAFGVLLFVAPDAPRAAVVASIMVLALVTVASSYVRSSLAELLRQAEREVVVQRRAELQLRQLHADHATSTSAPDVQVLREIEAAIKGVVTNLTLIAEPPRQADGAPEDGRDLAAVEQAVAKAVAECNQLTLGFAATLPSEHRHKFNNAVMPLSYALDKATKRLTRLLHDGSPRTGEMERVRGLLDGARASAERIGMLTRRAGTPTVPAPIV